MTSRLALGTVQFGLPYGVANVTGQVPLSEVRDILSLASAEGIEVLDTAASYGESEAALGRVGIEGWQVVTKLPGLATDAPPEEGVRLAVEKSMSRLGVDRLYGLLLHRPADLLGNHGKEVAHALLSLRAEGLVEKVGYSIYSYRELDALEQVLVPDLIQAPFNVFDQGMKMSGRLKKAHDDGIEVHARSAFLQGLLLMAAATRPGQFARWSAQFAKWDILREKANQSALEAALAFVLAQPEISRVVVGVDSSLHLREILKASSAVPVISYDELAIGDDDLINPSQWAAR